MTSLSTHHVKEICAGIKDEKYQLLILEKVGKEGLTINQARIVAENVARAIQFDGEKGAMAELRRPYLETYEYKPLPEKDEDIRGEFSWFKDKEVRTAMYVFQNFNNTITRLMETETDERVARKILTTMRAHLSTWLARIPVD